MANEMNAGNLHSTDIDRNQEERNDPEVTKSFIIDLLFIIAIILACVFGIVWILLNYEAVDNIKPEYQLVIFAVAMAVFGVLRAIVWFRKLI